MALNVVALHSVDAEPSRKETRVPGEPGIWVAIFGDLIVFVVLFVIALVNRAQDPQLAAESQSHLNAGLGAFNTVVLLLSSLLVAGAVHSLRIPNRPRPDLTSYLFIGAAACGTLFAVLKIYEYYVKISAGVTPMTNGFYLYYFMLTGFHWVHVIVGVAVLVALAVSSRRSTLSNRSIVYLESGACFWHMVDLLWLVLYALLYLVR
jgi:nitric oxide reductase NorE protein